MKNVIMLFIIGTLITASLTACFSDNVEKSKIELNKSVIRTELNKIRKNSALTNEQKADLIAQEAEKLINPSGFMFAYKILEEALSLDSNSQRALLLKSMLEAPMKLRGTLKRADGIFDNTDSGKKVREKFLSSIIANESLKSFLLDAEAADIKSELDIQSQVEVLKDEIESFRQVVKSNNTKPITISTYRLAGSIRVYDKRRYNFDKDEEEKLGEVVVGQEAMDKILAEEWKSIEQGESDSEDGDYYNYYKGETVNTALSHCNTRTLTLDGYEVEGEYEVICHDSVSVVKTTARVERPDFEAIQQIVAGQVISLLIGNGYDLTGAISVAEDIAGVNSDIAKVIETKKNIEYENVSTFKTQRIIELSMYQEKLGTNRNLGGLSYINTLGAEAIPAVQYALANQAKACPLGKYDFEKYELYGRRQREGKVFQDGICITKDLSKRIISNIETVLAGGTTIVGKSNRGELDIQKFISGNLSDLKSIGVSLSNEGAISVKDEGISGILVSKNANALLKKRNEKRIREFNERNYYYRQMSENDNGSLQDDAENLEMNYPVEKN